MIKRVKNIFKMPNIILRLLNINRFLSKFSISRVLLLIVVVLLLVQAGSEAFSAGLIVPFLNSLQNAKTEMGDTGKVLRYVNQLYSGVEPQNRFLYILLTILSLMSFVQVLIVLNNRLMLKFAMFSVQNRVSLALFEKILATRLKFFFKQRSGDIINNLSADVYRSFNCVNYVMLISSDIFFGIGYFTIAFLIMPIYSLALLGTAIGFLFFFKMILPYIDSLSEGNRLAQQDANNIVVESIQGFRNIVLSCAQTEHRRRFADVMFKYYDTIYRSSWITVSLPAVIKFLSFLVVGGMIILSRKGILSGNAIIFSKIMFFVYVTNSIFKHFGNANSMYSSFTFSYQGLLAIMNLDKELDHFQSASLSLPKAKVKFKDKIIGLDVGFEYLPGQEVLSKINFQIQAGAKVAFVGSSGSGKSTIADILSGFYDDYSGSIRINGVELREIDKKEWRKSLGYVSQETFIFNDTIRNNLQFGFEEKLSDSQIWEACRKAQILDSIRSFKDGFETSLGERGVRLSGGEKQRLAIARLFLKNPSIVILDEATSSLDSESEKKVKDALNVLGEGRTVIAVAHRLSTISDYNLIYVLEKGRMVENGNHQELIARKGYYHRYYTIQSMGAENGK